MEKIKIFTLVLLCWTLETVQGGLFNKPAEISFGSNDHFHSYPILDPNNPFGNLKGCHCKNQTIEIMETVFDKEIVCWSESKSCENSHSSVHSCNEQFSTVCNEDGNDLKECYIKPQSSCWDSGRPENLHLKVVGKTHNCKVKRSNPKQVIKSHVIHICSCEGKWSQWSKFSECSKTCKQTRNRTCQNLDSSKCVTSHCHGPEMETRQCPYEPEWSPWADWSPCSSSCETGQQVRTRTCLNLKPECGETCGEDDYEIRTCQPDLECDCTDWKRGECTTENGDEIGTEIQTRNCRNSKASQCGNYCSETRNISCTKDIWHMIIGGSNGTTITDSVELYNYRTNERCFMNASLPIPLSEHSGAVLDGVPYVCGGYSLDNSRQSGCYKFNKNFNSWEEGPNPNVIFNRAGSAFVTAEESKGWHIFGAYKAFNESYPNVEFQGFPDEFQFSETLALKYPYDKWETGFELKDYKSTSGQCVVQVNDNITMFFGGDENPKRIFTLDWKGVPKYISSKTLLSQSRVHSACTVFKYEGKTYVAIVGGGSAHIDIWDPTDQTIEPVIVSPRNPLKPEIIEPSGGLEFSQLLAVNAGRELLLYGGNMKSERQDGIFVFSFEDNSWREKCRMLLPRGEHVVLPVTDIDCFSYGGVSNTDCGDGEAKTIN